MLEKIYLGFLGKEKFRLGEILMIIKQTYESNLFISISDEKLYEYLSKVFLMYNLEKVSDLFSILSISFEKNFYSFDEPFYIKERKKFLKYFNDKDMRYCINIKLFFFLSERLWPAITKAFINNLSKKINYFYFKMQISLSQIKKFVDCENEEEALEYFEEQFYDWIDFHMLGDLEGFEKIEENNYQFNLKIIY